jgi:hypothetical protein
VPPRQPLTRLLRSLAIGGVIAFCVIGFRDALPLAIELLLLRVAFAGSALVGGNVQGGRLPFLAAALCVAFACLGFPFELLRHSRLISHGWPRRVAQGASFVVCLTLFSAAFHLAHTLVSWEPWSSPLVPFALAFAIAGLLAGALWRSPLVAFPCLLLSVVLGAWLHPPLMTLYLPRPSESAGLMPLLRRGGLTWLTGLMAGLATWTVLRLGIRARGEAASEPRERPPIALDWKWLRLAQARWREIAVGVVAVVSCTVVVAHKFGGLDLSGQAAPPWAGTTPFKDPSLEALFQPDLPVKKTAFLETKERNALYVAELRKRPPRGYEARYLDLLRSRGVFVRPSGGSAYHPAPIDSYQFIVLQPDVTSDAALSLRYREFWDERPDEPGGSFWWPIARWRSYPSPVRRHGNAVWVRLGDAQFAPWQETWPLPARDQTEGPELPVPRFPGSVVRDWGPEIEDRELIEPSRRLDVDRLYSVRGASVEQVVAFYDKALRAFGVTPAPCKSVAHGLEWSGHEAVEGVVRVTIAAGEPGLVWGRPLDRTGERGIPEQLFPWLAELTEIRVSVRFESLDDAVRFWPDAARLRRDLLLAERNRQPLDASPAPIAPAIAVLRCGFASSTQELLRDVLHEPVRLVPPALVSVGLLAEHRVLVIPTSGLNWSGSEAEFAAGLGRFVRAGGVVVAFAQPQGRDYAALPVPSGERLRAIGFDADQSVYAQGVRVDQAHPALASLAEGLASINVDGAFEEAPLSTRVLLRKTKSDLPALVVYPVGRGWVAASSIFDDCLSCARRGPGRPDVLRDLVAWAREPAALPWCAPGDDLKLPVRVANRGVSPASTVVLRLLSPSRDRVLAEDTIRRRVEPRRDTDLVWPLRVPRDAHRGIQHVTYTLLDAGGAVVQPAVESPSARVVVGPPARPPALVPDLGIALVLPRGLQVEDNEPTSVEYRLENRLGRERRLRLYGNTSARTPQPLGEHVLAPHGGLRGNAEFRPRHGEAGFWLQVFEVGGTRKGDPRTPVPGEDAAFQLVEGIGFRVSPAR